MFYPSDTPAHDMVDIFDIHSTDVLFPVTRHSHRYLELFYVQRGWAHHSMSGLSRKIQEGDYVIVDYGTTHSYDIVSSNLTVINCLFRPGLIDRSLSVCESFQTMLEHYMLGLGYTAKHRALADHVFHDDDKSIFHILLKLIQEYMTKPTGYLQVIRSGLIELIILTARKIEERNAQSPSRDDPLISALLEEIQKDPAGTQSLSQKAASLNLSVSQLSRRFALCTGFGYAQYLRKIRLEQACRLLINTRDPVSRIAEACGYEDSKHFGEIFRNAFGMTPRQYRKTFSQGSSTRLTT